MGQVAGMILGPGDIVEYPGYPIDIDLSARRRLTFFATITGETIDGTAQCFGKSELLCGITIEPTTAPQPEPTPAPTPSPTTKPSKKSSKKGRPSRNTSRREPERF